MNTKLLRKSVLGVAGLAFALHGWSKIQNPMGWMGPDAFAPGFMQALAAMIRADVNGEAYSLPRFILLGATEEAFKNADGSPKAAWQAAWDAVWAVGDDEGADHGIGVDPPPAPLRQAEGSAHQAAIARITRAVSAS